jgi:hypothetical protein
MSSWICVISNQSPKNWGLCKEFGLYGIAAYNRKLNQLVNKEDQMLFWYARHGFLGYGIATENSRTPTGPEEVPWGGGISRFSIVVPFKLLYECVDPVPLAFVSGKQLKTGISAFTLQRGFASITEDSANTAIKEMHSYVKPPKPPRAMKSTSDGNKP